jgi:hypothetical protein
MRVIDFLRYRFRASYRSMFNKPLDDWWVETNASGLEVRHVSFRPCLAESHSSHLVAWAEISRIVAYKQDNFTWDTIWLRFERPEGTYISVPEEAVGWESLLRELPARLPGCLSMEQWWVPVAEMAFAESAIQLYPPPA